MSLRKCILIVVLSTFLTSAVDAQLFRRFRPAQPTQPSGQSYLMQQFRYGAGMDNMASPNVMPNQQTQMYMVPAVNYEQTQRESGIAQMEMRMTQPQMNQYQQQLYQRQEMMQREQPMQQRQVQRQMPQRMQPMAQTQQYYYYRPNCQQPRTNMYAQRYYQPNVVPNAIVVRPNQFAPAYMQPTLPTYQSQVAQTPNLATQQGASVMNDSSVTEASYNELNDESGDDVLFTPPSEPDTSIIEPMTTSEPAPSMAPATEPTGALSDEIPIEGAGADDFSVLEGNDG